MNWKKFLLSPIVSLSAGYAFLGITITVLYSFGFYDDNSFFNWGPPIKLINVTIESKARFYGILVVFFIHQLINSWVSEAVYPWIVNKIQDSKTKHLEYSNSACLLIVNFHAVYSTLDMIFIVNGAISQISFLLMIILANIVSVTVINWSYLKKKTENPHSPLIVDEMESYGV